MKSNEENKNFDYITVQPNSDSDKTGLYYAITKENFTNPLVSPIFGDLKNLPPILIQVGGVETLRDQGTTLGQKVFCFEVDFLLGFEK